MILLERESVHFHIDKNSSIEHDQSQNILSLPHSPQFRHEQVCSCLSSHEEVTSS